jgi:D-alanyl-D-alanine carboxypeptidase
MIKKYSVLIFILIISLSCTSQIKSEQTNDTIQGIMTNHLKATGKKPVHSIQVYMSKGDSVFNEAVGYADGKKALADKDNQFKIASITKTMTAVVILQLQEEGMLNINDPVTKYISDVSYARLGDLHFFNGIPYGDSITIKQLLQHRSGLADIFTDAAFRFYLNMYFNKKQTWSPEKLMKRYYKYRLNYKAHFIPDSGYYYSDVNYFLLGLIIEKLSRQTLAQQFRKRIFEPLEMNNTFFEYYEPAKGNRKMAHSFLGRRNITKMLNTSYDWAGGGIVSTTTDLSIFLNGIFNGKLYKTAATLNMMTAMRPHPLKSGKLSYYGLGLYQYQFNGDVYYGHGGFWGSLIAYCPAKKITFCGSVNQVNPPFNTSRFVELLLQNFENEMDRKLAK